MFLEQIVVRSDDVVGEMRLPDLGNLGQATQSRPSRPSLAIQSSHTSYFVFAARVPPETWKTASTAMLGFRCNMPLLATASAAQKNAEYSYRPQTLEILQALNPKHKKQKCLSETSAQPQRPRTKMEREPKPFLVNWVAHLIV